MLLGVDPDEYPLFANSLDTACWAWGTWVDGKLQERKGGKGKDADAPKYTLAKLLGAGGPQAAKRQEYASPLAALGDAALVR